MWPDWQPVLPASPATTTRIYVDGTLIKSTKDTTFTYKTLLQKGCHKVRVVQFSAGEVVRKQMNSTCVNQKSTLIVEVNGHSVTVRTYST